MLDPASYNAWYETPKGSWIGQQEFSALLKLFSPRAGQTLLDIGSGSGYFTRMFNQAGLNVTGFDSNFEMNRFASENSRAIDFIQGDGSRLPFADNSFDYCSAITSLCFIAEPEKAIAEMLRVSRYGVMLGLLNRHSLLYALKKNSVGYQGARWDSVLEVEQWCRKIEPELKTMIKSAVLIPSAGIIARTIESLLPDYFPYSSFLAVGIKKKTNG